MMHFLLGVFVGLGVFVCFGIAIAVSEYAHRVQEQLRADDRIRVDEAWSARLEETRQKARNGKK